MVTESGAKEVSDTSAGRELADSVMTMASTEEREEGTC